MTGNKIGARTSYQDFFALWKDADPNISHPEASRGGVREAEVACWALNGKVI